MKTKGMNLETATVRPDQKLKLTLIRSLFGRLAQHKNCVNGLGLTRMHQSVQITATPENMGMVRKAAFMLKIEEIAS